MRGQGGYDFGMGAGASVKKGKGKKKALASKPKSKGNFKPGGSFTSGRAIPKGPGTAKSGSKKDSNMAKAIQRNKAKSDKPRSGY